jgi:hypothetical protein
MSIVSPFITSTYTEIGLSAISLPEPCGFTFLDTRMHVAFP